MTCLGQKIVEFSLHPNLSKALLLTDNLLELVYLKCWGLICSYPKDK